MRRHNEMFLKRLKSAPLDPVLVLSGYVIWEPEAGWPEDFMDMVAEMLRRGYYIRLVPVGTNGRKLCF